MLLSWGQEAGPSCHLSYDYVNQLRLIIFLEGLERGAQTEALLLFTLPTRGVTATTVVAVVQYFPVTEVLAPPVLPQEVASHVTGSLPPAWRA